MPHVAFVAPRFLENTNRYVHAFGALEGVRLSVISADPERAIPEGLRDRVHAHYQVRDPLDAGELLTAARAITKGVGRIDRLAGALEQLQVPLAEVRDALDIDGLRVATARRFRDKDQMKAALRRAGVPVAKSALCASLREVRAFADQVGFPIVVKPQAGVGARATYRVTSEDDIGALAAQGIRPSDARPVQVEEFVRARENTCETVTIRGEHVWRSGTHYLPSPLEVLETPWIQYCVLLPREVDGTEHARFAKTNGDALSALLGDAAKTAAGTALTHMEWFQRDDGSVLVNEVGIRPPGVGIMPLMSIAFERDMVAAWCELTAFDRFTPPERKWAAGAAFLRGTGRGDRIVAVEGIDEAVAAAGDSLVEMRTPKVGMRRADGYEGEGWAYVRHATTAGAKEALLAVIRRVRVRYG